MEALLGIGARPDIADLSGQRGKRLQTGKGLERPLAQELDQRPEVCPRKRGWRNSGASFLILNAATNFLASSMAHGLELSQGLKFSIWERSSRLPTEIRVSSAGDLDQGFVAITPERLEVVITVVNPVEGDRAGADFAHGSPRRPLRPRIR